MTLTDIINPDADCTWCECGLYWNARMQRWEDKNHETFCPSKLYFPFVHQAEDVDDSGAGGDTSDYA